MSSGTVEETTPRSVVGKKPIIIIEEPEDPPYQSVQFEIQNTRYQYAKQ